MVYFSSLAIYANAFSKKGSPLDFVVCTIDGTKFPIARLCNMFYISVLYIFHSRPGRRLQAGAYDGHHRLGCVNI